MATQSVSNGKSVSPAGAGAIVGGIVGLIAAGGSGLIAGAIVGAIEALVVVGLVEHFGKPAWAIVMSTLKAVFGSIVGAAIVWGILTAILRDIGAKP